MKYLVKFNEAVKRAPKYTTADIEYYDDDFFLDKDYIYNCFTSILDSDRIESEYTELPIGNYPTSQYINIFLNKKLRYKSGKSDKDLDIPIKYNEELLEILKEIRVCFKRIKLKYPKYIFNYNIVESSTRNKGYIHINITTNKDLGKWHAIKHLVLKDKR
jgi:hypothetical protein